MLDFKTKMHQIRFRLGLQPRPRLQRAPQTGLWSKNGLGPDFGLAYLVLCCETRSCHAGHHNDIEGHRNFSSTICSFSMLCLEHYYCEDQQWRLLS